MTSWIPGNVESLNPEQQAIAEDLAAIIDRLDLPHLDVAASSVAGSADGLHVTLIHTNRPDLRVDVDADVHGEVIVSYGVEHEHFRSEDATDGRVWPFPSTDHIEATLTLVECLLTGRVELHIWKRPFGVKTRSFWINDNGQPELFLRSGTVGPFIGWSRAPEIHRFDFTSGNALT